MKAVYEKYFRNNLPHIWCAGCGNGTVMAAYALALEKLGYENDDILAVSGIGCSSRITGYLNSATLHTAHGRALPFASGAKMCEPKLKVFVFMGDGDCTAIGGNHFIHACRRNIDITAIVMNNNIYGMTGGQYSPLTPYGKKATTAPYGNIDNSFDLVELARGAGATYVARGDVFHMKQLADLIVEGARHKGFSVIEAMTPCPTSFGRYNKTPDPAEMLKIFRDNTVGVKRAATMTAAELQDKIITGCFVNKEAPEYVENYDKLIASFQGGAES